MAAKKGGLGRGLSSLFEETTASGGESTATLRIADISPDREQPRKSFDDEALSELAASIEKHGVLQPIVVRPVPVGGYKIVAGERRWRAARLAGLKEIPPSCARSPTTKPWSWRSSKTSSAKTSTPSRRRSDTVS